MVEKETTEELLQRIIQLEQLAWGIFRALETYITVNELQTGRGEGQSGHSESL